MPVVGVETVVGVESGMPEDKSRAPAVESAVRILELLSTAEYPLTLTEISQQLSLPASSTHRIIAELQRKEMVDLDSTRQKSYNLGSCLFRMVSMVYSKQRLIPYFHPIAEILKSEVNLSVVLSIPIGSNAIVTAKVEPGMTNNPDIYVGKTMPLHTSAAGKAMLSMRSAKQLEHYLQHIVAGAMTESTITDIDQLNSEITRCQRLGYAITEQELSNQQSAIAAPILNLKNESIAAISIYTPDHQHLQSHIREYLRHLIQAARQLSSRLQYA